MGRFGLTIAGGAALAFAALGAFAALAQSPECDRLRQAINDASFSSNGSQYLAAADRQQAEIDRMAAYARSIGCDTHRFLFFGAPPPAQCGQINEQIGRMHANLDDLRSRSSGGANRSELIARYNAQCASQPGRSGNIFDSLFGQPPRGANPDVNVEPVSPDQPVAPSQPSQAGAGSQAVCVRTCDGSFFPVSYAANSSRYDYLADMCRSLCPNAETALFTYPFGSSIEQAVSPSGQRYVDSPNALKYRTSFDSACTCRRRGQSWSEALAGAEAKLGPENKGDVVLTPQRAAELSRPKLDTKPDPKAKPTTKVVKGANAATTDANGVDTALSAQTQAVSREASGILGSADANSATIPQAQGNTASEIGPDGVMRQVRVIGPSL